MKSISSISLSDTTLNIIYQSDLDANQKGFTIRFTASVTASSLESLFQQITGCHFQRDLSPCRAPG
eukprot:scaffold140062_cov26-Prasinocladus_malaysianus.AAC.1